MEIIQIEHSLSHQRQRKAEERHGGEKHDEVNHILNDQLSRSPFPP